MHNFDSVAHYNFDSLALGNTTSIYFFVFDLDVAWYVRSYLWTGQLRFR